MPESILDSCKATLGVEADDAAFDTELILFINGVLSDMGDLGLGPPEGFRITNKDQNWEDFLGTTLRMESAKNYMYLQVRLFFDAGSLSGQALQMMKEQIEEHKWRLNVRREDAEWVDPNEL